MKAISTEKATGKILWTIGVAAAICYAPFSLASTLQDNAGFSRLHDQVDRLWFDQNDYAAIAELGKPVVSALSSAADIKINHQEIIYRICVALFEVRDYASTFKCLDNLKAAVLRNGDRAKQEGFYFFQSQRDFIQAWPILPKVDLFLADMWLELGQPRKALDHAKSADAAYQKALDGNLLSDTDKYFQFGEARHHFLSTLATAYRQTERHMEAADTLDRQKKLGLPFTKEAKTYAEAKLLRTYIALGKYDDALGLLADKSESSDRAREAAGAVVFSALMLALSPVDAIVGGGQAFGRALYGDMHTPLTRFLFAHARLEIGDYARSKIELDLALSNKEIKGMSGIYWSALYDRGRIAEKEGEIDSAIRFYREAIAVIEEQRSTVDTEGARIGFFGDKQAVYQALLRLLFQSGKHEEAFLVGERSKSRALVDMLASKQDFHIAAGDSNKIRELLATAQIGEASLNRNSRADTVASRQLTQRTLKPGSTPSDTSVLINEIRTLKVEAKQTLASQAPELAALVSVPHVSLQDIQNALPADETLLSYYFDKQKLYAFIITRNSLSAHELPRGGLEDDIKAFRNTIQEHTSGQLIIHAQSLHNRLIAPLVGQIATPKLLIAAHGPLHYLPFLALSDGRQTLLERYQLTQLPSATTIKYVGKLDTRLKPGMLLAFGNPDLGDRQYDLDHAEIEAREVAGLFPNSKVLVRQEASKKNLKEYGSGFRYLHFATHGKFDAANPLGSALMLATPSLGQTENRLTIDELYSMRFDADLVTLSACETGLGDIANGDDVVGLVRGFLYAGANRVVSTLWEIDDVVTAQLMTEFYRQMKAGRPAPEALRNSQLATLKIQPHPFFWAAFQITGGGKH